MTPNLFKAVAAVVAVLGTLLVAGGYLLLEPLSGLWASGAAYVVTLAALLAFPKHRSANIIGMVAVLCCAAELADAAVTDRVDLMRWMSLIAGIGAVVLPLRVRDLRRLAAVNGYLSFSEWKRLDRRQTASDIRARAPVKPYPVAPILLIVADKE